MKQHNEALALNSLEKSKEALSAGIENLVMC